MNKFYAVLIVIFFVFYFADRAKRRKAKRASNTGQCIRCGGALEPMQWEIITAAGSPLAPSQALACSRCARRDTLVRTVAWIVVGFAFAATVALLVIPR